MGGYEKKSKQDPATQGAGEQAQPQSEQQFPPYLMIGRVSDVVEYIEKRPADRDPLFLALQRYRGNEFVQEVVDEERAKQAQTHARAPSGVGMVSLGAVNAFHHAAPKHEVAPPALDKKKPTSEQLLEHAQGAGNAILGQLVPGYIAARDRLDVGSVAALGGQLSGVATHFYGALAAHAETPGDQTTEIKAQILKSMQPAVTAALASGLPPQMFRGRLVGPSPVAIEFSNAPNASHLPKLLGELERTIKMIELVHRLHAKFAPGSKAREDHAVLAEARLEVVSWQGRALDLSFLKVTLGPVWELLDSTATPMDPKPSKGLEVASHEANRVGWIGDTGTFDVAGATAMLQSGGSANAKHVLQSLYTADPDTRAKFLMDLRRNKVLDSFCKDLSWQEVKQLHDSLGYGFGDIKSALQPHFLGDGKYGPSLGEEFENHDRSLVSLIDKIPVIGDGLNFALDVGTFGFHSSYGRALDDYSNGRTSANERDNAKAHAAMRTAATMLVATVTGGAAGKMVRGGAETASVARATASGVAAGGVGSVAAVGTSDLYNNFVSKTQSGASSPEDYVKALLLGGAFGGAFEMAGAAFGSEAGAAGAEAGKAPKEITAPTQKQLPAGNPPAEEVAADAATTEESGEQGEPTKRTDKETKREEEAKEQSKPPGASAPKPRGKKPYHGAPPKADVSFNELVELAPGISESELRELIRELEHNSRHIKKPMAELKDLILEYKTLPKIKRAVDLARDGAQGDRLTPTSLQESFVGQKLETSGKLKGPIRRYPGKRAEFIDGDGETWDVKGPRSGSGAGSYKLKDTIELIEDELNEGHNVIIDATKMKAEHIVELRAEIESRGWTPRVRWYP